VRGGQESCYMSRRKAEGVVKPRVARPTVRLRIAPQPCAAAQTCPQTCAAVSMGSSSLDIERAQQERDEHVNALVRSRGMPIFGEGSPLRARHPAQHPAPANLPAVDADDAPRDDSTCSTTPMLLGGTAPQWPSGDRGNAPAGRRAGGVNCPAPGPPQSPQLPLPLLMPQRPPPPPQESARWEQIALLRPGLPPPLEAPAGAQVLSFPPEPTFTTPCEAPTCVLQSNQVAMNPASCPASTEL